MLKVIGKLGDIGQVVLPLSGGGIALHRKDYKGFCLFAVAVAVNQIAIEIIKNIIQVERPNGRRGSFPSGHTVAAFTAVGFLARRYDAVHQMPWTLCVYSILASMVGVFRVLTNNHWVSDVVGGALLGVTVCVLLIPTEST